MFSKGFGPQTAMMPGKTEINLPNNVFFLNLAWTLWVPIGSIQNFDTRCGESYGYPKCPCQVSKKYIIGKVDSSFARHHSRLWTKPFGLLLFSFFSRRILVIFFWDSWEIFLGASLEILGWFSVQPLRSKISSILFYSVIWKPVTLFLSTTRIEKSWW